MKSEGSFFPQVLISKLKEIGISMLMPRMLALIAVQRCFKINKSLKYCATRCVWWAPNNPTNSAIKQLGTDTQL
jgi:hypothetical protein